MDKKLEIRTSEATTRYGSIHTSTNSTIFCSNGNDRFSFRVEHGVTAHLLDGENLYLPNKIITYNDIKVAAADRLERFPPEIRPVNIATGFHEIEQDPIRMEPISGSFGVVLDYDTKRDYQFWYYSVHGFALANSKRGMQRVIDTLPEKSRAQTINKMLWEAAANGHTPAVDFLLQFGADVNHVHVMNTIPIDKAVMGKHSECVQLLIKANSKIDHEYWPGKGSCLTAAIHNGDADSVRLLVGAGADVHQNGWYDVNLLHAACARYCDPSIILKLLDNHVNIDAVDQRKNTALHRVSSSLHSTINHREAVIKILLDYGANSSITNKENKTYLDCYNDRLSKDKAEETIRKLGEKQKEKLEAEERLNTAEKITV